MSICWWLAWYEPTTQITAHCANLCSMHEHHEHDMHNICFSWLLQDVQRHNASHAWPRINCHHSHHYFPQDTHFLTDWYFKCTNWTLLSCFPGMHPPSLEDIKELVAAVVAHITTSVALGMLFIADLWVIPFSQRECRVHVCQYVSFIW